MNNDEFDGENIEEDIEDNEIENFSKNRIRINDGVRRYINKNDERSSSNLTKVSSDTTDKIKNGIENVTSNIPSSNPILLGIKAERFLRKTVNNAKAKLAGKSQKKIEEDKKKKKKIIILKYLIPIIIVLVGSIAIGTSDELVESMDSLIKRREERYAGNLGLVRDSGESYKPLILFTEQEYYDTIYKDEDNNDYCYKTMLRNYANEDSFLDVFGNDELKNILKDEEEFEEYKKQFNEEIENER